MYNNKKENFDYEELYSIKVKYPIGPINWMRNQKIHSFFDKIPNKNKRTSILDIGCGKALLDIELVKKGHSITAIDVSKNAIEFAMHEAKRQKVHQKIKFYNKQFEDFKLKNKFDIIICSEVLEHIKDDNKFIKKIYKHLKRNGYLILSVPYDPKQWNRGDTASGHFRRYMVNDLNILLKRNGFRMLSWVVWGFPLMRFYWYLYRKTFLKRKGNKKGEYHSVGYVPKKFFLKLYKLFFPFFIKLFYVDNLFEFTRKGFDVIVLAKK